MWLTFPVAIRSVIESIARLLFLNILEESAHLKLTSEKVGSLSCVP
jgi:hypothetical protein